MTTHRRRKRWQTIGMIWLIFAPVMALSLWLLALAGSMVVWHLAAQSWQPVPATLIERGVHKQQSPGGGDAIAGASRLTGRFVYVWHGQTHESTRISFSSVLTRSVGSRFDDWDERLDGVLGEPGDPLTVWVDPSRPSEAVALRAIRWSELAIYIGFGLLLLWTSAIFLLGINVHAKKPGFSWRAVAVMWVVGSLLGVLAPLLWHDGHPVWAVISALPLLLAINGTVHGLRSQTPTRPQRL